MFPQPDVIRLMSWGITLGIGVGQMRRLWKEPGEEVVSVEEAADGTYKIKRPVRPIGGYVSRVLRTWDPKYLRYQWWDDSWWLMTADGEIRIEPNDGEWLFYCPYGALKPWEYGAWKALTLAFILGRDAMFDRSRHAEVLAPVRVGKVPQGTTEKQRRKYLDQIREMQRMHMFVLPPGLEYTIVESTGRIADIYNYIIDWARSDYTVTLTGNETTTTGSKGFSSGDVQERIAKHVLKSFATSLSDCLHDGGLIEWGVANFDDPDVPRPIIDTDPPEDKKAKAETLKTAGEALTSWTEGLKAAGGLRPTAEAVAAFAQTYGFEVEAIPSMGPAKPRIEVAQADLGKCFTIDEVRAGEGYDPIGDERGEMTPAQADALAKAPPQTAPPDDGPEPAMGDAPPTDEAADALAAKMTQYGIERCEHGACNRCRLCGVERLRDFAPPERGKPHAWRVAWRPIHRAPSPPISSLGGQA